MEQPPRWLRDLGEPQAIQRILRRGIDDFATGRLRLERVAVRRFEPRADGSWLAQYDVRIRDPDDGRAERQVWVGWSSADAERRLESPLHPPLLGRPVQRLRDPSLLLWVFPNDPVLPDLVTLWDSERFADYVHAHREEFRLPALARVVSVETERVKYVGLARCTLRHVLTLDDGGTRVVFSKTTHRPSSIRWAFEAMRVFHASRAFRSVSFSVAEPFFFDPQTNALFVPGLQGTDANERLGELDLEAAGSQIGAALAALQQCEIEGLPESEDADLLQGLPRTEAALAEPGDSQSARVAELGALLAEAAPRLPGVPVRPVHGAFRLSQLLVTADGFALIDFDRCARANPILDVGSFVAHLLRLGHKGKLSPERAAAGIRSFCRAYDQSAPWGLPQELLRWHTAAQLLTKHARRAGLQRQKKDEGRNGSEHDLAARLVVSAEAILKGTLELV